MRPKKREVKSYLNIYYLYRKSTYTLKKCKTNDKENSYFSYSAVYFGVNLISQFLELRLIVNAFKNIFNFGSRLTQPILSNRPRQ